MAFNCDRAALVLVEATYSTDKKAAELHAVSVRSIESWRSRLEWDDKLQCAYQRQIGLRSRQWVRELPECLRSGVKFLQRACEEADPSSPEAIEAVTGAIAALHELLVLQDMLERKRNAKLATD